ASRTAFTIEGSDAWQPHLRTMDRGVRDQPQAPGEPRLPYGGHPDDRAVAPARSRRIRRPWALALGAGAVRDRLDLPVRRPLLREEAARVLQGLALPPGGTALVVREAARQGVVAEPPATEIRIRTQRRGTRRRAVAWPWWA